MMRKTSLEHETSQQNASGFANEVQEKLLTKVSNDINSFSKGQINQLKNPYLKKKTDLGLSPPLDQIKQERNIHGPTLPNEIPSPNLSIAFPVEEEIQSILGSGIKEPSTAACFFAYAICPFLNNLVLGCHWFMIGSFLACLGHFTLW